MSAASWPRMIGGRWVTSPLAALGWWASTAHGDMVAVPIDLLMEASRWRECSERHTETHDEDGPLSRPIEVICRKQQGHDDPRNRDHVRQHHNGYAGWSADDAPPLAVEAAHEVDQQAHAAWLMSEQRYGTMPGVRQRAFLAGFAAARPAPSGEAAEPTTTDRGE